MKYDMANGKKKEVEPVEKGSDPTVLYNNYIKASKHIGVKPSKSLLRALADEGNPARGTQIIIAGEDGDLIGPGGCRALVNAMIGTVHDCNDQQPYVATKDLRILSSGIKDGGAIAISTLLFATARRKSINTTLDGLALEQPEWKIEHLELVDDEITTSGASSLGRALSVGMNKTLTSLVLDFNSTLRSEGVTALCKGLSTNSTLKKISLKYCSIDERAGMPIAKMLQFKRLGLISMDLSGNVFAAAGLVDICSGLAENSSLHTFKFAENSIGQTENDVKALETFADVLSKNTSLTAVDLLHNRIGNKGGSILLNAVKANANITEFKVDSDMVDELYSALYKMGVKPTEKKKGSKKKR